MLALSMVVGVLCVFDVVDVGVAVRLVPTRPAPATAVVFSGISVALVLGVPVGTWLGQRVGWRWSFLALAGLGALSWMALAIVMPRLPAGPRRRPAARSAALLRTHPSLRTLLAVTALVVTGNYAAYTYIVPVTQHSLGFSPGQAAPLLLVYGIAGVVGNLCAGLALNHTRSPHRLILVTLTALSLALAVLPLLRTIPAVVAIGLWGLCYSAVPVMLQTRIFAITSDQRETATSLYVLTFNTCIAAGAFIGGLALQHQPWLPITIAAACTAAATVLNSKPSSQHRQENP